MSSLLAVRQRTARIPGAVFIVTSSDARYPFRGAPELVVVWATSATLPA